MTATSLLNLVIVALVLVCAVFAPRLLGRTLHGPGRAFHRLAQRRVVSVLLVMATVIVTRLALLAWISMPEPIVNDEFSHLLAADTFASGRLTNPPHPLWRHFETLHVIQQPTYASMYPPTQGLFLALGKVTLGYPWAGVVLSIAVMCGAICWMLQGWLPPTWAFAGGLCAALRFGLVGYWINGFWGGAPAAIGGALVLGALPRITRQPRVSGTLILVAGLTVLANSRPYEGFVLSLTVAAALVAWLTRLRGGALVAAATRFVLPASVGVLIVAAATCFYFSRVTGDPFRMPYQVNRATYASAPYFIWQAALPAPEYHSEPLRRFYQGWEMREYATAREDLSWPGMMARAALVTAQTANFVLGPLLMAPFVMLPWMVADRRVRFLLLAGMVMIGALTVEVFYTRHYPAPMTALWFALSLQGVRHIYVLGRNRRVGQALVRGLGLAYPLLVAIGIAVHAHPFCMLPEWPWAPCPPFEERTNREQARLAISSQPGKHLAIVRYRDDHDEHSEWVYNDADIDRARIVWARELSPAENVELIRYFHDRAVWLVEMGPTWAAIHPYPRVEGGR